MKPICPECGHEGDSIYCDEEKCERIARTYCSGCECWRCAKHKCECDKEIEE